MIQPGEVARQSRIGGTSKGQSAIVFQNYCGPRILRWKALFHGQGLAGNLHRPKDTGLPK